MNTITQQKFAIIGKVWLNKTSKAIIPANIAMPEDITFNKNENYILAGMSFRTDRNLAEPVTVKAGDKLFLFNNPTTPERQEAGLKDADYSVSVQLPIKDAMRIIDGCTEGRMAWKAANLAAAAA